MGRKPKVGRKPKGSLQREQKFRDVIPRVLIVCEGQKTELNYFNGLLRHFKLNTAKIEVVGDTKGTDPSSILSYATNRYDESKKAGNPINEVYCVFDKDQHAHYASTVDNIKKKSPKDVFFAITSVPCFEYWILLHFEYTNKPYKNGSDEVITDIKKYLPDYTKSNTALFSALEGKLDIALNNAIKRAKRVESEGEQTGTDNPSTKAYIVVEKLQGLAKGKG